MTYTFDAPRLKLSARLRQHLKTLGELFETQPFIHERIAEFCVPTNMKQLVTSQRRMPDYRFPDLFYEIERRMEAFEVETLDSSYYEDLGAILSFVPHPKTHRRINKSTNLPWAVGVDREEFFPSDRFWLARTRESGQSTILIVRLRKDAYTDSAILECAAADAALSANFLEEIVSASAENSIYRNQVIRLSFEPGTKDEYADVEMMSKLRIVFQPSDDLSDEQFIVNQTILDLLKRNVIDLHTRRDVLKSVGVPIRRGILFYGPPGTGKTYACRYLSSRLPKTTKIYVAGPALTQVSAVFSLARLMKPSCVFLEDADLVYAGRDMQLQSSVLGDLLDHMDGLQRNDEITIIVTTNSLDRMEQAIKDRPGRISQLIYFGPPASELRQKYLRQYAKFYDCESVDFSKLAEEADGATQAFLKEWTYRAVQIATEVPDNPPERLKLSTDDYLKAIEEMKRHSNFFGETMIGFRPVVS